jgi:hypothetical protein
MDLVDMPEQEPQPMKFSDLIPNPKMYDKMRPPKIGDNPTKVTFFVTVMGLDSINEYSMVCFLNVKALSLSNLIEDQSLRPAYLINSSL